MKEQFGIVSAARMALLFALPCYLLLNLVFAAFKVVWEERTKGEWIGRRFVYFEPVLARSEFVMAANNNKISKFRFKDAEPGSMIYYKFQRDGPENFLALKLMAHPLQLYDFKSHRDYRYTSGGVRVGNRNEMCLKYFLYEAASPFQLRIYVTSWEV